MKTSLTNRFPSPITSEKILDFAIYFFIIWYIFICVVNFLNLRPLWNDEQCVFQSIAAFSYKEMFGAPLMALQVFPRLYLFLIQQFSSLFNFEIWSLRVPSFVCMMAAFFIWLKIAKYELQSKFQYLTFVLSWTASSMLLYYSAELKQYSMDVLTAAIFVLFIYNQQKWEGECKPKQYFLILTVLPFLGLFSYTAFFFPFIVMYNFLIDQIYNNKQNIRYIVVLGLALTAAVSLSYFFDMRFKYDAHSEYSIFLSSTSEFFKSFTEGINNLFSRWLVEHPRSIKRIGRVFMIFGFFSLFHSFFENIKKDKYVLGSLKTIPFSLFLGLVILGILKKYPFVVPRTALFFCPFVLYLTIKGIVALRKINHSAYCIVHSLYLIFLVLLTISLSRLAITRQGLFQPII